MIRRIVTCDVEQGGTYLWALGGHCTDDRLRAHWLFLQNGKCVRQFLLPPYALPPPGFFWAHHCLRTPVLFDGRRSKENARLVPAVWVDVDPPTIGDLSHWQNRKLAEFAAFAFPPSIVVASGRGFHAYWRLDPPVSLSPGPRRAALCSLVEGLNRTLAHRLGGDSAHDLTRHLRVPGTRNPKNRQECLVLGRDTVVATMVTYDFQAMLDGLEVADMPSASWRPAAGPPPPAPARPRRPGRPRKGCTVRDLRSVPPLARQLIIQGPRADPNRYRKRHTFDRSRADMAATVAMVRADWDDGQIFGAFSRPDWAIGEKFRELRQQSEQEGVRYLLRTIAKARHYQGQEPG